MPPSPLNESMSGRTIFIVIEMTIFWNVFQKWICLKTTQAGKDIPSLIDSSLHSYCTIAFHRDNNAGIYVNKQKMKRQTWKWIAYWCVFIPLFQLTLFALAKMPITGWMCIDFCNYAPTNRVIVVFKLFFSSFEPKCKPGKAFTYSITSYLSRRSRRHLEDDTTANFIHIFGATVAKTNFSGWRKCLCCDKWELSWETQHSPQVPVTAAAYTSASPLRAAFSRTDPDCLWLAALNVGDRVTLSKKKWKPENRCCVFLTPLFLKRTKQRQGLLRCTTFQINLFSCLTKSGGMRDGTG